MVQVISFYSHLTNYFKVLSRRQSQLRLRRLRRQPGQVHHEGGAVGVLRLWPGSGAGLLLPAGGLHLLSHEGSAHQVCEP